MNEENPDEIRYSDTVDPVSTDRRDIDTEIGTLGGEGASQEVVEDDRRLSRIAPDPGERTPAIGGSDPTYYDRPMLKPSVWTLDIPFYYFTGGAAGAALTLGASLQLAARGRRDLRKLSATCHWIGIIGSTAGAAFLIHDLGRPMRFLAMMRVFRPTSPMNMGVWILSGAAPTAIAAGLLINRGGILGALGESAGYASGIFGAGLAGYTGVLVANTAIPVWQASRRWLPVLFMASSASAAASIIDVVLQDAASQRMTRLFGTLGRVVELAAARNVEHCAATVPKVAEPFHRGKSSVWWKAGSALTLASLALSAVAPRRSKARKVAGILGAAGSLCLRLAVHYIGEASAMDPRAAFHQQRNSR
jgi:formate-dependent nitrite reductase membrane component NrfD